MKKKYYIYLNINPQKQTTKNRELVAVAVAASKYSYPVPCSINYSNVDFWALFCVCILFATIAAVAVKNIHNTTHKRRATRGEKKRTK